MERFRDEGTPEDLIGKLKRGFYFFSKERFSILLPIWLIKLSIFYILLRCLFFFMRKKKKDEKVILAFDGYYYNGNVRAVYELIMQKYADKYECYWVARNYKTFKDVRKRGGRVFMAYSLLGLPWYLKTDVWLRVQTGIGIFSLLPHKNYKVIQLKHGVGPKGTMPSQHDFEMHDAWCVSSQFIKKRHVELWNAPPEKLYATGFARMDLLLKYLKMPKEKLLKELGIKNGRKIILHAPTFDVGLWPWGNPYEEFEKFCKFCKEKNLILILRLHPFAKINKRKLKKIIKKYDNVYWLDMSKEPDTMKLLAITDILITDWSSIYTDFFLTKRPIIFLEVNKEYFTKIRGKPEVPPEYRAGEIVHNSEEFYEALEFVLKHGNRFEKEQEKLLKIIHGDVDGKASERVVKLIEELLKK